MALVLPSISSCASRMTTGEKRLAERLERKLDDAYSVWFDIAVGPRLTHPDFIVLHPERGLLILETKHWSVNTIVQADPEQWLIRDLEGHETRVLSPLEQVRRYAHDVTKALSRDAALCQPLGRGQGKLLCTWSYGVVFTNITRTQFLKAGLDRVIDPRRTMCSDEMTEATSAESFESRLWEMFSFTPWHTLQAAQLDRIRWILFPEVRIGTQGSLFDSSADEPAPEIMRVFDLQQEQLARSLGDGHRIVHGVAGSGKTMILTYRAEYLARASAKPILVICFSQPLAEKLASTLDGKAQHGNIHVVHFHRWCLDLLKEAELPLPSTALSPQDYAHELAISLVAAVLGGQIADGRYFAVLIDEAHDLKPEWLDCLRRMADPTLNSLLLLYDDSQSIFGRSRARQFSFRSVGIQAQGRTTVLKINYRNTRQILRVASLIAKDLITAEDADDDGIPILQPMSCGREGEEPKIFKLRSVREEADKLADLLQAAHAEGHSWGGMAILCRANWLIEECVSALSRRQLPFQVRKREKVGGENAIALMTMHASKGLEFPIVALPGIGHMPHHACDEKEEARLFYVAATRATHKLFITMSGDGAFGKTLSALSA